MKRALAVALIVIAASPAMANGWGHAHAGHAAAPKHQSVPAWMAGWHHNRDGTYTVPRNSGWYRFLNNFFDFAGTYLPEHVR